MGISLTSQDDVVKVLDVLVIVPGGSSEYLWQLCVLVGHGGQTEANGGSRDGLESILDHWLE